MGHVYSLENEINEDEKSGRSIFNLSKYEVCHLFSAQVVLALYLTYEGV